MKRCPEPSPHALRPHFGTATYRARARRGPHAFTLVELIVIIVVLSILSGVAIGKYIDYTARAKQAADQGSIGAIRSALTYAFVQHRVNNDPPANWIAAPTDVASTFQPPTLPDGITISGTQFLDRRGNFYDFTAETASLPARVTLAAGSPGP
jgi:type II secretory pathway pseudopilin PulG